MPACNRRSFLTRVVLGTAAVATVGRALAAPSASAGQGSCANCQFYTPTPGSATGTCAFASKTVTADGGCGEFTSAGARSTAVATGRP
jgi:hypothetical protein